MAQHFPNEISPWGQVVLVIGLCKITREVFGADSWIAITDEYSVLKSFIFD
jgi:hypothetical protein